LDFPKLVIFDMDGLMFDTERIAYEAWQKTAEHFGFTFELSIFCNLIGLTNQDIIHYVQSVFGPEAPVLKWREYMKQKKKELLEENLHLESFKKKGLESLLSFLKTKNVKIAVASSNEKAAIERYLKTSGVSEYIDLYVSGEEVKRGKPNPDVFLEACLRAEVKPSKALVIEDSPAGIKAAYQAGIPSFMVPDYSKPTSELREMADQVFDSLESVEQYLRSL